MSGHSHYAKVRLCLHDTDAEDWSPIVISLVKPARTERVNVRIDTPAEETTDFISELFALMNTALEAEFAHGQEYNDETRAAVTAARGALWHKAYNLYDYTLTPYDWSANA